MTDVTELSIPALRFSLHVTLQDFVRNPWRAKLSDPFFFTDLPSKARFKFISELHFFTDHIVDDYDYSDVIPNVGRVFWTLEESQCVGWLAHIIRSIFKRTPEELRSDPTIFLHAPEWPNIERLASEALTLVEAEDARRNPESVITFERKRQVLRDLEL